MALRIVNTPRPRRRTVGPSWVLDCLDCGRPGDVELRQDVETGDLVDAEGTRAWDFVCSGCGSDDLCPAIADHPLSRAAHLAA